MAIAFAITIDGVLADQGEEPSFAASKLIPEGVYLYRALTKMGAVSLISLQNVGEATKVDYWLGAHGLDDHTLLVYDPHPLEPSRGVPEVLALLRRSGPVDLVIEASAERAARFLHHGASTTVLARPAYTRSEFRPDEPRSPRLWDEVIAELDAQRDLSSTDNRTDDEGVVGGKFASS